MKFALLYQALKDLNNKKFPTLLGIIRSVEHFAGQVREIAYAGYLYYASPQVDNSRVWSDAIYISDLNNFPLSQHRPCVLVCFLFLSSYSSGEIHSTAVNYLQLKY